MKTCTKCKIEKELSEFCRDRSQKDGLHYRCRDCCRKYQLEYRKTKSCKEAHQKSSRKQRQLCPEKEKAQNAVSNAIRDGKLIRPSVCESCPYEGFIEAHHEDYNKPLDVCWLCKKCHIKIHRKDIV